MLCTAYGTLYYWLIIFKTESIETAMLKIQSGLAGMFQSTVIKETRELINLIEDKIGDELNRRETSKTPTFFDELVRQLMELQNDQTEQSRYNATVIDSLAKAFSRAAKRLLRNTEDALIGYPTAGGTGLPFSFKEDTERKLTYIAKKVSEASRRKKRIYDALKWAKRLLLGAFIFAFISWPWLLWDSVLSYRICVFCLALFSVSFIGGILSVLILSGNQIWLKRTSSIYGKPEEWFAELAS